MVGKLGHNSQGSVFLELDRIIPFRPAGTGRVFSGNWRGSPGSTFSDDVRGGNDVSGSFPVKAGEGLSGSGSPSAFAGEEIPRSESISFEAAAAEIRAAKEFDSRGPASAFGGSSTIGAGAIFSVLDNAFNEAAWGSGSISRAVGALSRPFSANSRRIKEGEGSGPSPAEAVSAMAGPWGENDGL
ncbi:MAG: hypothetical protein EHM75_04660 [Desulfobacteraceae bacterium]|nr:MAG: hypothetical protein EHM75_04660 [Desulfobacteraceae bacterium]